MRTALLGALVGAGLVIAAMGVAAGRPEAFAQDARQYRPAGAESQLIALATVVGEGYQQVTVVDPAQRVMSVYHIELATGAIELRCVRQIHWDLQMVYFNGKGPMPREIQLQLEAR